MEGEEALLGVLDFQMKIKINRKRKRKLPQILQRSVATLGLILSLRVILSFGVINSLRNYLYWRNSLFLHNQQVRST